MSESEWRQHSMESGCRIVEGIVADKRARRWVYHVTWVFGIVLVSAGHELLADTALVAAQALGGVLFCAGMLGYGRYMGQQWVVEKWRESLDRPIPGRERQGQR